jgi:hypothetical protein
MLLRGAAVLTTAALHAHAVAAVSLRLSPIVPFDEPFDDFYVSDPYSSDDRRQPPESPDADSMQIQSLWMPHNRTDWAPFRGPQGPNRKTRWDNRLLIEPSRKLAFCYIEKNACTQFNRLFNAMNGIVPADNPFWKTNADSKNYSIRRYFEDGADNISKATGWKMAIFLRDPAERFLSAWLSKCDAWEHGGIDCLGPQVSNMTDTEKVELFENTVLEVLPKYMKLVDFAGQFNAHYDPQHVFCSRRPLEEYEFVGKLSGSPAHIQDQVVDMLKREAGIEESDPLMDLPRKLFPALHRAGHGNGSTG